MALLPERNKRGGYKALRKINDRNYQYSGPIYPYVEQVLPVYGGGGGFGMTGTQPIAGGGFVTSSGYGARDIGSVRNDISQKAIDYSVGMQDANQRALDEYVAMMSRYGMQPDRGVINKYAQTMTQPSQASLTWGATKPQTDYEVAKTADERAAKRAKARNDKITKLTNRFANVSSPSAQKTILSQIEKTSAEGEFDFHVQNIAATIEKKWGDIAAKAKTIEQRDRALDQRDQQLAQLGIRTNVAVQASEERQKEKTEKAQAAAQSIEEEQRFINMVKNANDPRLTEGMNRYAAKVKQQLITPEDAFQFVQQEVEHKELLESRKKQEKTKEAEAKSIAANTRDEQSRQNSYRAKVEDVESTITRLEAAKKFFSDNKTESDKYAKQIDIEKSELEFWKSKLKTEVKQTNGPKNSFMSEEEAASANLPIGSIIYINGRKAIVE